MSLTKEDLTSIDNIVKRRIAESVKGLVTKSELKSGLKSELKTLATKEDLDRMETRMTTAMGLLERDHGARLEDHEARIKKLESQAAR